MPVSGTIDSYGVSCGSFIVMKLEPVNDCVSCLHCKKPFCCVGNAIIEGIGNIRNPTRTSGLIKDCLLFTPSAPGIDMLYPIQATLTCTCQNFECEEDLKMYNIGGYGLDVLIRRCNRDAYNHEILVDSTACLSNR